MGKRQVALPCTVIVGGLACAGGQPTATRAEPADIRVYAASAGRDLDPDGYAVTLDGQETKTIGVNDFVTFTSVTIGPHTLDLAGVAGNCWPAAASSSVTVSGSGITPITFHALCMAPIPEHVEIAFVRDGMVNGMRADGSEITNLTNHFSGDPAWSPDGSQLAFVSFHDDERGNIYVVHGNGTGLRRLTHEPGPDREPAWSPDGKRIVFRRGVATEDGDLYIVDADGAHLVSFTESPTPERDPTWSRDGSRIAFMRVVDLASDVFTRALQDGSEVNLTQNSDYNILNQEPSWSPDGTRIAFRRAFRTGDTGYDVYAMNADGSGQYLLVGWPSTEINPTWSPDGTKVIFSSGGKIYVIGADRSGLVQLTRDAIDFSPSWRPTLPR